MTWQSAAETTFRNQRNDELRSLRSAGTPAAALTARSGTTGDAAKGAAARTAAGAARAHRPREGAREEKGELHLATRPWRVRRVRVTHYREDGSFRRDSLT